MKFTKEEFEFAPGYVLSHLGYYRDAERFKQIAQIIDSYSDAELDALKTWFSIFESHLLTHHHAEDDFFIPKLLDVIRESGATVPNFSDLKAEHDQVDEYLGKISTAFSEKNREVLASVFTEFATALSAHLQKEEDLYLQNNMKYVSTEQAKVLEEEHQVTLMKQTPKKELLLMLAWMLDELDENMRDAFFKQLPLVPKTLYKFSIKKKYERIKNAALKQ